jgi:glucan endo-1,3-alpha-glucosidase
MGLRGFQPYLRHSAVLLASLLLARTGLQDSQAAPHYVFAHYMVCFATYGDTQQAYEREISEAQEAGIDGFALNVGAWNGPDWYYKSRVRTLHAAAEKLNTGFKLFFSVDMPFTNDIVEMISTYAPRTNSFRHNGKVVVSTSGQNHVDWTNGVIHPLRSRGVEIFFVPYFLPEEGRGYDYGGTSALVKKYHSVVDGLFYFAAGTSEIITNRNAAYGRACGEAGKLFMGGYSPSYWGCNQPSANRHYFETQGGEGTVAQWSWILANQPDWVEIVTWNDFHESTYVCRVDDPGLYFEGLRSPRRHCHSGYLELSKPFILAYKTGSPPAIERDSLFYFYRTHPKNAVATSPGEIPVTSLNGDVRDVVYVTTLLKAPAELVIASGGVPGTNSVPAGVFHVRAPFAPGRQVFTLRRDGGEVLSTQGPDIQGTIQVYNFFPASGFAHGRPSRPGELKIAR